MLASDASRVYYEEFDPQHTNTHTHATIKNNFLKNQKNKYFRFLNFSIIIFLLFKEISNLNIFLIIFFSSPSSFQMRLWFLIVTFGLYRTHFGNDPFQTNFSFLTREKAILGDYSFDFLCLINSMPFYERDCNERAFESVLLIPPGGSFARLSFLFYIEGLKKIFFFLVAFICGSSLKENRRIPKREGMNPFLEQLASKF